MEENTRDELVAAFFKTDQRFARFSRRYLNKVRQTTVADKDNLAAFLPFAMSLARQAHGQLFQDIWALWEADQKRGGYFVEFGAANGIDLSNTYLLETAFGWTGILAEPNPAFLPLVKKARSCFISDKCVYSHSGEQIAFLPTHVGEFSRIKHIVPDDMHEISGGRSAQQNEEVLVATVSLNDLLIEAKAPPVIDFMSIDTEGSEFEILRTFDFDRWRVQAICVEHNYTPLRQSLYDLLTAKGYRRKWADFSDFDDWYVLN